MKGKVAYRTSLALRAESAILSSGRGDLGALEQHPPGIFVSCVEEPVQSSVLGRVGLPQVKARCWHERIRRMSMTWTTLTSLSFLFTMF